MLSIGKLSAASVDYYCKQLSHSVGEDQPVLRGSSLDRRVDYYAGYQAPSRWMGSGLSGAGVEPATAVTRDAFARLMGHETLSSDSMTRAHATHGSVAAFDHTLSAPKSVSLLYAFGDSDTRREVMEAHRLAVDESVAYLEARCAQARVGTRWRDEGGRWHVSTKNVDSDGWVAAAFDHYTSRANDPQLHTHVVAINRVHTEDGWRALDARRNYLHAKAAGTLYEAALREELTRRLGVSWGPVVNGIADIEGFSPELIAHFSTRRAEILEATEAYLARNGGQPHGRMLEKFTLETRQPKSHPRGEASVTREMREYGVGPDVVAHWQRRAIEAPQDPAGVVTAVLEAGSALALSQPQVPQGSASLIAQRVTDRQATFTERDLLVEVAASFPEGAKSDQLIEATRGILEAGVAAGDVVPLGERRNDDRRLLPGEGRYTTVTQLERERSVLAAVGERSPVKVDLGRLDSASKLLELVPEQTSAIRSLARLESRLVAVTGPGGSGKTYAMGAYAEGAQAAGYVVLGVAPTATAAQKLADGLGGHWTGTIAMLAHHLDREGEALQQGTVVICDEASMVSTNDLARVCEMVRECDGKLVLLGDPAQLPAIDSGGLFHRIVADGREVVTDFSGLNQRQRQEVDRRALELLRTGDVDQAIHHYTEAGRLHLGRRRLDTMAAMVEAWWDDTKDHGSGRVAMLAGRRSDVELLNHLARSHMQAQGLLAGHRLQTRSGLTLQAGDRIVVRTNWYRHCDLRNGQLGTVTAVDPATGHVAFRRDHDGINIVLPRRYVDSSVELGYAQTIHTAQGHTFQRAHVYVDQTMTVEHGYTGLSRASGETHIWSADPPGPLDQCRHIHSPLEVHSRSDELARQLSRSGIRLPATDEMSALYSMTDHELINRRDELAGLVRACGAVQRTLHLEALDEAIAEARSAVDHLGTSGARIQLKELIARRDVALATDENHGRGGRDYPYLLHEHTSVLKEIDRRVAARTILWLTDPQEDLLATIGLRTNALDPEAWDSAVAIYAKTRLEVGPAADLNDPAVSFTGQWRDAVHGLNPAEERAPVLTLTR